MVNICFGYFVLSNGRMGVLVVAIKMLWKKFITKYVILTPFPIILLKFK